MSLGLFVLAVLFLTIVAPVWIIAHYLGRWRANRALSRDDQRALGELWESAQRIEARVENLEKVLDAQAPGWRSET